MPSLGHGVLTCFGADVLSEICRGMKPVAHLVSSCKVLFAFFGISLNRLFVHYSAPGVAPRVSRAQV